MYNEFPLWPERASTFAGPVDMLFIALIIVTGAVSLLIWLVIFTFAIKYRRRPDNELAQEYEPPQILEIGWIVIPTIIFIGFFLWGAWLFFREQRVPDNALDVYATSRQWMWKFQHAGGQREINTLHVPVNSPVRITMASEDVIHSLWFPAFRVKADVLPSRYRTMWFQATKTGTFHIFCAEYCGTQHSGMIGSIVVLAPAQYETWMSGGSTGPLSATGEKVFAELGCATCHRSDAQGRGPNLQGLFGKPVRLQDGRTVVADENYIRESILDPGAKIVNGYKPVMPTFQGLLSEEQLNALVAYLKSLSATKPGEGNATASTAQGSQVE